METAHALVPGTTVNGQDGRRWEAVPVGGAAAVGPLVYSRTSAGGSSDVPVGTDSRDPATSTGLPTTWVPQITDLLVRETWL